MSGPPATYPVPVGKLTFNPETGYYGFAFNFEGHPVHHAIDTFPTLELANRWADPWDERMWEDPSDADETALFVSTRKKPGAL